MGNREVWDARITGYSTELHLGRISAVIGIMSGEPGPRNTIMPKISSHLLLDEYFFRSLFIFIIRRLVRCSTRNTIYGLYTGLLRNALVPDSEFL